MERSLSPARHRWQAPCARGDGSSQALPRRSGPTAHASRRNAQPEAPPSDSAARPGRHPIEPLARREVGTPREARVWGALSASKMRAVSAISTIRPRYMTRHDHSGARRRSGDEEESVEPRSRSRRSLTPRLHRQVSPAVGSSRTTIRGAREHARERSAPDLAARRLVRIATLDGETKPRPPSAPSPPRAALGRRLDTVDDERLDQPPMLRGDRAPPPRPGAGTDVPARAAHISA